MIHDAAQRYTITIASYQVGLIITLWYADCYFNILVTQLVTFINILPAIYVPNQTESTTAFNDNFVGLSLSK